MTKTTSSSTAAAAQQQQHGGLSSIVVVMVTRQRYIDSYLTKEACSIALAAEQVMVLWAFKLTVSVKAKQQELDRMAARNRRLQALASQQAMISLCHRHTSVHISQRMTPSTVSGVMPSESQCSLEQQSLVLIYRRDL